MEKIAIIGSGGLAKEIAFLIEEINRYEKKWEILGFIDNENKNPASKYRVFNNDDWLMNVDYNLSLAIGIGNPNTNYHIISRLAQNDKLLFPNIIHPNTIADWERIKLGQGNVFCAGNILTTDIRIGSFNLFNLNGTIGHDTSIGDFNVFNPTFNISGNINLEDRVFVGTGAQILQNLYVCNEVIIGAGAVVTKNLTETGTYVGMPARKIK